jgi:hypothetical protein
MIFLSVRGHAVGGAVAILISLFATDTSLAQAQAQCAQIANNEKRLACYDEVEADAKMHGAETGASAKPAKCEAFERESNSLRTRLDVGLSSPAEFRPLIAGALEAYRNCGTTPEMPIDRLYRTNLAAYQFMSDVYSSGIRRCAEIMASDARILWPNGCEWKRLGVVALSEVKALLSKYPSIQDAVRTNTDFGDAFDSAYRATVRFQ